MSGDSTEELLKLNHEIRNIDHQLRVAQRRRKRSNLSLILGPCLAGVLYVMYWIPWIDPTLRWAIYLPTIPIALGFGIYAVFLKMYPGGPLQSGGRPQEGNLELYIARKRDTRKNLVAQSEVPTKVRRITYKEDAYQDIDDFRTESNWYRRVNNILQGVLIVGSLLATGTSGIAVWVTSMSWLTPVVTFAVGISSGFMGYFKYKERSFYLQQTADAIEHEWEAVEIGVGRYKRCSSEEDALAEFVEEVHRLKTEQKQRQQNLEQPAELRDMSQQGA